MKPGDMFMGVHYSTLSYIFENLGKFKEEPKKILLLSLKVVLLKTITASKEPTVSILLKFSGPNENQGFLLVC